MDANYGIRVATTSVDKVKRFLCDVIPSAQVKVVDLSGKVVRPFSKDLHKGLTRPATLIAREIVGQMFERPKIFRSFFQRGWNLSI